MPLPGYKFNNLISLSRSAENLSQPGQPGQPGVKCGANLQVQDIHFLIEDHSDAPQPVDDIAERPTTPTTPTTPVVVAGKLHGDCAGAERDNDTDIAAVAESDRRLSRDILAKCAIKRKGWISVPTSGAHHPSSLFKCKYYSST